MYKPTRWTFIVAVAVLIAGCTGSEHITEPVGRPSMETGWGYGSGGRSGADSTTTTQSAPASADTTAVL
jgi:hypothetical protein